MAYTVWLEFEQYAESDVFGVEDGYCNIEVIFDSGEQRGYNVWTIDFFRARLPKILKAADADGFAVMPDILVSRLERQHILDVLKRILPKE